MEIKACHVYYDCFSEIPHREPFRGCGDGVQASVRRERNNGERTMKGLSKVGAVLATYVAAFLAGCAAVYCRQLLASVDPADASGGMAAFGDEPISFSAFRSLEVPQFAYKVRTKFASSDRFPPLLS
jgi:hypothetical protein